VRRMFDLQVRSRDSSGKIRIVGELLRNALVAFAGKLSESILLRLAGMGCIAWRCAARNPCLYILFTPHSPLAGAFSFASCGCWPTLAAILRGAAET